MNNIVLVQIELQKRKQVLLNNHTKGHEDINHVFVYVRLHAYATKYLAVISRITTSLKRKR